jgi:hypothetical protein
MTPEYQSAYTAGIHGGVLAPVYAGIGSWMGTMDALGYWQ